MSRSLNLFELAALKKQLRAVRQRSLSASREGDYRTVARLTCEATRISRRLLESEGLLRAAA